MHTIDAADAAGPAMSADSDVPPGGALIDDSVTFRRILGHFATGIVVVTAHDTEPIGMTFGLRERNDVFGQRCCGIDRDQRQIRLPRRNLFRQRHKAGLNGLGHRGQHRGRLQLRDRL